MLDRALILERTLQDIREALKTLRTMRMISSDPRWVFFPQLNFFPVSITRETEAKIAQSVKYFLNRVLCVALCRYCRMSRNI